MTVVLRAYWTINHHTITPRDRELAAPASGNGDMVLWCYRYGLTAAA